MPAWRKFRRKPEACVIEAYCVTGDEPVTVETANGPVDAQPGNWVCKTPKGDEYPCTDEVLKSLYYQVTNPLEGH